ncbi:DEAD/DEAH box helicase [Aquabacter spiritensis]|uniref:ATP-dependent RNA helicase DeaD n=1 Tax=Aquabacter spiritensis TaxID=933073 RepID=A0A4R3LVQ6_9HYPH|nr:DEAD/DEAH box helicase [Aquabacter spiritensis]TCT04662.1 ATP-dependent RNA helicase DeaD [Aquabacter spiritensis]
MAFSPPSPSIARALAARDYAEPTPVQALVLAPEAAGRDLLVSAQTGSGKTVAYGLAIAETLLGEAEFFGTPGAPQALIVAPTRELALQVQRELTWLYEHARARIVACVGGMDPRRERRALADGVHIVVGTPGRLRDHIERGGLDLSALAVAVLDEADEMLDLGFREDLEFILSATPPDKRALLFSATLPKPIVTLAKRYQSNALRIEVAATEGGHADIAYRAVRIVPKETEHAVVNLLRYFESPTAIVFCNTRESVRHLLSTLQERGFAAVGLSGEMAQNERNQALQALRDGRARVCVATDVAARGIDLPNLGLVIHAELPHDAEALQHRSGRTGRAGRKGSSILLVPPSRRRKAEQLLAFARVEASWSGPPSPDEIRVLDQERMLADPLIAEEPGPEETDLVQTLLAQRSPEHLAAALVRLYRDRLPAPEDVLDPGEGRTARSRERSDAPPARSRDSRGGAAGSPGGEAGAAGTTVWFRMPVGRRRNADPKWLLPLICRRGDVTKQDVGSIRIFDSETVFEVAADLADEFLEKARASQGGDVLIEPMVGGAAPARAPRTRKPAYDPVKADRPPDVAERPKVRGAFGKERRADGTAYPKGPKAEPKPKGEGKPKKRKDNAGGPGKPKRIWD